MAEEENTTNMEHEEEMVESSAAEAEGQEGTEESTEQVEGGEQAEEGGGNEGGEEGGDAADGEKNEEEKTKEEEAGEEQKEEGEGKEEGDGATEGGEENGAADGNEEVQGDDRENVEETESGEGEKQEVAENEETGENEAEPEAAVEEKEEVPEDGGKEEAEETETAAVEESQEEEKEEVKEEQEEVKEEEEKEEKEAAGNDEETLDAEVVANGGDDGDEEIDEVVKEEEGEKEAVTERQTERTEEPQTNGDATHVPDFIAMSTNAEPADLGALQQAIADVRNDDAGVGRKSWVLVGHTDNNPNVIDIVGQDVSAEASLEDFVDKLEDDQVMYGLLRLTTAVDMSNTVKFVYIHWVGDNVPFAKKGRFGVVHGSVKEHFGTFHVQLETGNKDELKEEELVKVLEESSFTRNKVLESGSVEGRQERGFTAHQVKAKQSGYLRNVAPAGAVVEIEPELNQAIGEVRNDKNEKQWVLAGYQEGNLKKPLTLIASGSGDIEELKESLLDDQVMYGLLRTSDMVDAITTVKFVYIYWVGDGVKPLMKGKVSAYAGPVEQVFSPIHVTLSFGNRYEITPEIIKDKVMAGSGSKSFVK